MSKLNIFFFSFQVLREYVPSNSSKKIKVTGIHGVSFGATEPDTFDKILVDAPCSSDRHVIKDDFQHSGWSVRKSRDHAKLQKQLLVSALASVKTGGTVVYSTCTLSPYENDEAVEHGLEEALKKHGIQATAVNIFNDIDSIGEFSLSRTVNQGVLIVPSKLCNWGPMYTSKILRTA